MTPYETITYAVVPVLARGEDGVTPSVARITLARPEAANAQNNKMTYELDHAFTAACADPDVKVIVLDGQGKHFSSGHDLRDRQPASDFNQRKPTGGLGAFGVEGHFALEEEVYLGMCWRWRNLPKPTIAAAHGKTIAGGLMLLWVCDLIIASDDAVFSDPTVAMGVNGVEYFAHPWELGPRKAKEILFTSDWLTAADAHAVGMVNHVVPRAELESFTMAMATRIAAKPAFALKLSKESVNQMLEAQGQWNAFRAAFSIQHIAHAHNRVKFNLPIDPSGMNPAVSTKKG